MQKPALAFVLPSAVAGAMAASNSTNDGAVAVAPPPSADAPAPAPLDVEPATPSPTAPGGAASITSGKALFDSTGCGLCLTPTLHTGNWTVAALRNKDANLFSDLMLHDMGDTLADGIAQGQAGGREFRTTPLWGVGRRLFLLHDGRTADISQAVLAHASSGSEANEPVRNFL